MTTLVRLLRFMAPFRWQVALAVALGCATVASNIGLLGMAAYLIAAAALKPLLIMLTLPIYIVRFMGVSRALARYAERLVSHSATFRLLARLRAHVFARLVPLTPGGLASYRSGDVLTRLVADVEELQNVYLRAVSPIVVALIIAPLTAGLFSAFSPALAWTALAFLAAAGAGVPLLAGLLARDVGRRQLVLRADLHAYIVDNIQGAQDVLACGRAADRLRGVSALDRLLAREGRRMAFVTGLQRALGDLLMNLAVWVMLLLVIPLVAGHTIDGVYLAFLALVILASFEAVQPLGGAFQSLGRSVAAGRRLFEVIDAAPAVTDPASPLPFPAAYDLEFDHVSFAYPTSATAANSPWDRAAFSPGCGVATGSAAVRCRCPAAGRGPHTLPMVNAVAATTGRRDGGAPSGRENPARTQQDPACRRPSMDNLDNGEALHDITFRLEQGRRIAIVGPSGSGKTTLIRLAQRFWDPTGGAVRLGGQDIRRYAPDDLRRSIGVVAQDTYIFNNTLRANLLLARPDATDDEIARALRQGQLDAFVRDLPRGLDTWVGEQGLRLSGGERQRLAIARALLKDAPLLILDEATANLDPATERAVLDALDTVMRGRTTLMITHRLIAMDRFDEILVLQDGRVVERGGHDQLYAAQGLYRRMVNVQEGLLALA